MKDAGRTALKVGLVGAAATFIFYVAMSLLINSNLDDYYNKPHDWISDDVGFFWVLAYFSISYVVVIASGPVSTLFARARIRTWKDALVVPAIACSAEIILSIVAVMTYAAVLSAGNLLPYFRDIYTSQITPMSIFCMPAFIWCAVVSVFFGYLLYVATKSLIRKSPG